MSTTARPARDLALIAVFAGVTAALGLIPPIYLPITPTPITAQSLVIILAGAILGGRRGFASQALLLGLVALGLPLLAGGRGGIGVFFGVTWGFLLGYPVVAGLVGWLTYRIGAPYSLREGYPGQHRRWHGGPSTRSGCPAWSRPASSPGRPHCWPMRPTCPATYRARAGRVRRHAVHTAYRVCCPGAQVGGCPLTQAALQADSRPPAG